MNLWMARRCPPGSNGKGDVIRNMVLGIFFTGMLVTNFANRYHDHYADLFIQVMGKKVLNPEAVMPEFALMQPPLMPVILLYALIVFVEMVYYHSSYYQESKSIYLMKRLPDPWERWRLCLTLPALSFLLFLLLFGLAFLLTFAFYQLYTPEACLTPRQGQKFWTYTFQYFPDLLKQWLRTLGGYGNA